MRTMPEPDHYNVLGVSREATADEIKRAYRKLAKRYHPDRNPGDKQAEARFKEAAESYAVLSDPEKRARYDRFGHRGMAGGGFGGFDPDIFGDFADILGDFFAFGSRRSRRTGQRGADLRYELLINLEEAASRPVMPARGVVASRARLPRPAPRAVAAARCSSPRASSRWHDPVRNAAARGG